VKAWQHHFAATFGLEALGRVRGFSPAEMALPNHPDVAFEFVQLLRRCGYEWVLVQEHTVERPEGDGVQQPHLPHRLVCRSSTGAEASIVAVVKTQGSDTKLAGQMQPYYEAKGLARWELAGRSVLPLVTQIADGENGGVMMNEFPPKYMQVVRESSGFDVLLMNVSEYLGHLFATGITETDLPAIQPIFQKRIWDRFPHGAGPERLEQLIEEPTRRGSALSHGGRQLDQQHFVDQGVRRTARSHGTGQRAVFRQGTQTRRTHRRAPLSQRAVPSAGLSDQSLPGIGARGSGSTMALKSADAPATS
jgi:hypothetical protein